jgi:hypothetical protein
METAGTRELENMSVLAGDSLRFMILCAPLGPAGKQRRSPRSKVCSPLVSRRMMLPLEDEQPFLVVLVAIRGLHLAG